MTTKARILIVEDEARVVYLLREVVTAAGYDPLVTFSGDHAVGLVAVEQPDLVILDIRLAGSMDGYEVCRRLREFSEVPILMLTGKDRETDLLKGFESGADDYMNKPFSSKELLARIGALLKRTHRGAAQKMETFIDCEDLRIDLARRTVSVGDRDIHLTPTEYNLLHELAIHPNQVLTHEHLLTEVWGAEYRNDVDYLRAYIHSLRQKIEADPSSPRLITRCPGVGYMLTCPEKN